MKNTLKLYQFFDSIVIIAFSIKRANQRTSEEDPQKK